MGYFFHNNAKSLLINLYFEIENIFGIDADTYVFRNFGLENRGEYFITK